MAEKKKVLVSVAIFQIEDKFEKKYLKTLKKIILTCEKNDW